MNLKHEDQTRRTAIIASFTALCIGTNYIMLPFPNVKVMDAIIFTTGLFFGRASGIFVAIMSWLVYGVLNPLGFTMPTLLTVILCETIYALSGNLLRRTSSGNPKNSINSLERSIIFGVVGLFSTLSYDIITNAVYGLLFYDSVWLGLLTMNVPFPLGIIHEASNFFLFATITPVLLQFLSREINIK